MSDLSVRPDTAGPGALSGEPGFGDFVALLKPRVMSLVVFTGIPVAFSGGMIASGALNMWWDADIDAVMRRTSRRPVPAGKVTPGEALAVGLGLSGIAVVMLGLATNGSLTSSLAKAALTPGIRRSCSTR